MLIVHILQVGSPIPRVESLLVSLLHHYLESAVNFERCPPISIRTVSYSEAGDILVCITPALWSDLRNSNRSSEVKLDPLLPVVLLSWPSSLITTFWFLVQSGEVCGMVTIPFTWCFDVPLPKFSLGDTQGLHNRSTSCKIKGVINSYSLLTLSIQCYAERQWE